MPEAVRRAKSTPRLPKLDSFVRSPSTYIHPVHAQEPLSPTSRRFDAVIRRFGLPITNTDTPRARQKPKREQDGSFSPPISPPLDVQTTYDSPAEHIATPSALQPPPRPPRAASRSRSSTLTSKSSSRRNDVPPLPSPEPVQAHTVLQAAFDIDESASYTRERRISGILNGLGLAFSTEEGEDSASDHFVDARERLSEESLRRFDDVAVVHADRAGQVHAHAETPLRKVIRQSRELRDLAHLASDQTSTPQKRGRPRSMSLPGAFTDVRRIPYTAKSEEASESSATADVLSSYTDSPEAVHVAHFEPVFEEPVDDEHLRRARRASDAAVRSWLPNVEPPEIEQGGSPLKRSKRQSKLVDVATPKATRTVTRTSWRADESLPDRKVARNSLSQSHPAGDRRRSKQFLAEPFEVKQEKRAGRRRSQTESAITLSRPVHRPAVKPAIKSATASPAVGSSPFQTPASWRSTLQSGEYDLLLSVYGADELKRQEVIAELCSTETAFVNGLRGVVRLFLVPLRQSQGTWIRGVPTAVARLFDWLEDIVWLHGEISQALESRRAAAHPIVNRIADVFLGFVQRLEVHQPYLIRFDTVSTVIEDLVKDHTSDFGEFVRMQQQLPECGKMTLLSFLLKPIQRLLKYPLFFKQLCDLTPASHPDHLASLSLMHSTDAMIRVMQEVKAREEEYASMKALASRFRDLPRGFQLARRERRLLAHGQLQRVHRSSRSVSPSTSPALPSKSPASLASRLMPLTSPTQTWQERGRRNSITSDTSLFSDVSAASSALSSIMSASPKLRFFSREEPMHVFVYTDIIVLATWHPESRLRRGKEADGHYRLVEHVGLARVLNVIDLSTKDHEHLIELSLLPIIGGDESIEALAQACSAPTTIHLALPAASSPTATASRIADRQRWVASFEQGLKATLRALAMPTTDVPRWSVESTLAAGLPLPRSPSDQSVERGKPSRRGEREERGYWAGRLKTVRREYAMEQVTPMLGAPALPPMPHLATKKSRGQFR